MVIKSIDTYEKREQLLRLRARVLQAEWEKRIDGAKTMSATEARKKKFERETRRAVELTVWIDTCEVTGNVPRGVFVDKVSNNIFSSFTGTSNSANRFWMDYY